MIDNQQVVDCRLCLLEFVNFRVGRLRSAEQWQLPKRLQRRHARMKYRRTVTTSYSSSRPPPSTSTSRHIPVPGATAIH